jgi:hypothetical protein
MRTTAARDDREKSDPATVAGKPTNKAVSIPKADGKQRPLAVAALEDKIVQRAAVAVLNAIYEEDFLGFSATSYPTTLFSLPPPYHYEVTDLSSYTLYLFPLR